MSPSVTEMSDSELIELVTKFMKKCLDKIEKGKGMIWIDESLLKWIDKKVNDLTYTSRSQAIESLIADKIKEMQKK